MSPFFMVSKVYSLNYLGPEEIFYIHELILWGRKFYI